MNTIAVLALTVFHPGYCFPQMQMRNKHLNTTGDYPRTKVESDYESGGGSPPATTFPVEPKGEAH